MSDGLLGPFVSEARELVQAAADDLMVLEGSPFDAARIDSVFRAFHTLKGSAGLLDLAPMGAVLHAGEDVLGAMRQARLPDPADAIDALLRCIGLVESWVEVVSHGAGLPGGAEDVASAMAGTMAALLATGDAPQPVRPEAADWVAALLRRQQEVVAAAARAGEVLTALRYLPDEECFYRGDDPLALMRGVPLLRALEVWPRTPWPPGGPEPFRCNLMIQALSAAPLAEVRAALRLAAGQTEVWPVQPGTLQAVPQAALAAPGDAPLGARNVRVDAARVDELADVVGELVVAKNVLAHLANDAAALNAGLGRALRANLSDIDRLAAQLQRGMAQLRAVKLEQTFRRLPRVVRETAAQVGKHVVLEITGTDTEADKAVVDGLYEPLLHGVRNAIDHGIEDEAGRRAAGKSRAGRIQLVAERSGELLVVTVRDDGAGIDASAVRRTAVARGVITDKDANTLSNAAALDLVFLPGFSTAGTVTDISGRGVGLDAVRRALAALGGTVSLASEVGEGCTLRLAVPLAVAVTTIVVVRAGELRFGVPIETVVQTMRLKRSQVTDMQAGAAFVLRERTVPLVSLGALLGLSQVGGQDSADHKVLVAKVGDTYLGMAVDGFGERIEVVVRPLAGFLAGMPGMKGTALLGDGSVLLVLDIAQLAAGQVAA